MPGIPGRGERIGSAWVRVFFEGDNSGIDDALKDAGLKKSARKEAAKVADAWSEGWIKKIEKMNQEEVDDWVKKGGQIKAATTRTTNDIGKIWDRYYRAQHFLVGKSVDDVIEESKRLTAEVNRETRHPIFQKLIDQAQLLASQFKFAKVAASDFGTDFRKGLVSDFETVNRVVDSFIARIGRMITPLRKVQPFLAGLGGTLEKTGESMSRIFGAGARNNFFNLFGKFIGGLPILIGKGLTALGTFGTQAADELGQASKTLTEGMAEAESTSSGLFSTLASGIPGIIAVAAAMTVLWVALGLASSAIMLLTGAVIALASALSFALVGGLVAVAGALVPVAAAVGVAILAFKNMSKEQKKAFSGVGDSFKALGKVASAHLFKNAAADVKVFSGVVDSLLPIVAGVANAMRQVGEGMLHAMSGPGAKRFIAFLGQALPDMIRTIGRIAVNLGGFLADMFRAATPLVNDFLGWLLGVSDALSHLGDAAPGKASKLTAFLDSARTSMHQVGDAISEVAGLIGDLLFSKDAQGAGNSMFEDIANSVRKFRNFLKQAKDDGSLHQFFEDAKELGRQLGRAVVSVGRLIAALDTPETRRTLLFMIRAFSRIVDFITTSVRQMNQFINLMETEARAVGRVLVGAWHLAQAAFSNFVSKSKDQFAALGRGLRAVGSGIASFFSTVWSRISEQVGTLANSILIEFRHLPDQIVGFFSDLGHRIVSAMGDIVPHINWPDPPGWVKKIVPGMATGGIVFGPTQALIGERGMEAVVPLTGPLSRVDPAVRELSAIARGMGSTTTNVDRGRSVSTGPITIITPTKDPKAVATQVVNRIAAASYI